MTVKFEAEKWAREAIIAGKQERDGEYPYFVYVFEDVVSIAKCLGGYVVIRKAEWNDITSDSLPFYFKPVVILA